MSLFAFFVTFHFLFYLFFLFVTIFACFVVSSKYFVPIHDGPGAKGESNFIVLLIIKSAIPLI